MQKASITENSRVKGQSITTFHRKPKKWVILEIKAERLKPGNLYRTIAIQAEYGYKMIFGIKEVEVIPMPKGHVGINRT